MTNEYIVQEIQSGNNVSENIYLLYKQNKGFIRNIILQNGIENIEDIKDAEQNAFIGIWKAAELYDETAGTKFLTFAKYYINKEIRNGFHTVNTNRCIVFSSYLTNLYYKVKKTEKELLFSLGNNPSESEIASACNLSTKQLQELRMLFESHTSLYAPVKNSKDGDLLLVDCIEDSSRMDECYETKECNCILFKAMEELPHLEKDIVIDFFFKQISPINIAKKYGKSKGTIHSKLNTALFKMRKNTALKTAYYS